LVLLASPALAGDIVGHQFSDDPAGRPGIYDPGLDTPSMEPMLLTQIGVIGGPPGDEDTVLNQWFTMPDGDGFFSFTGLPDDGIFQIDLPFQSDAAGFQTNIITTDPTSGDKTADPVPPAPNGIVAMPPTATEVDIPILPASAPCAITFAPEDNIVMGGLFVDRNPGGQTGGNGITGRGGLCTIGNQGLFGEPADGIEVVLQGLDASGNPTGTPLTVTVGDDFTFVPPGETDPFTLTGPGWFVFLNKALADGETVRVSIDPNQAGLAGLLPVAPTTVERTLDLSAGTPDERLPVIEFRFQPVFDLTGRVTLEVGGTVYPVAGITLELTDLVTGAVLATTTSDPNGDYEFLDLFNSVYLVKVLGTGATVAPSGVRQIENLAPTPLDFAFTEANCPDTLGPTITVPADISRECDTSSGTAVTWAATATDNMTPDTEITITYAPFQPGDTIPAGVNTITVTAEDLCGNTSTDTFTITITDTTPPVITSAVPRTLLWPARGGLIPVGLTASATDICDGNVDVVITVFSDEGNGVGPFSPDANGTSAATLRLRSERAYPGNGRVYLIRITATDAAGNTAVVCKSAYVPIMPYGTFVLSVRAQAASGEAACLAADPLTGIPAGYVQLLQIGAPPPPQPN
nr:carboxypeptidase-like regulatory domain-containing protein [Planctomycetota bacterium]